MARIIGRTCKKCIFESNPEHCNPERPPERVIFVQVSRYAGTEAVREGVRTIKLHKIITVWYGTEMVVCEEV
ncbi:MAG: hypothetical protein ACI3ZS_06165 [Candidatus Cryptobacteroides sp.]